MKDKHPLEFSLARLENIHVIGGVFYYKRFAVIARTAARVLQEWIIQRSGSKFVLRTAR